MTCSYIWITTFTIFSIISENDIRKNLKLLFVGAIVCYIINMHIMYTIVRNPFCLTGEQEKQKNKNRALFIFSSISIVIFIILNLYLLVLYTHFSFKGAYKCSSRGITKWKLLYYTIISFTTVGYGDIYPKKIPSQAVAVLISITSVICLIVFISSVLSAKKPTSNDNIVGIKEENVKRIKIMIKKGYTKEDILDLDYTEDEYKDAEKELFNTN